MKSFVCALLLTPFISLSQERVDDKSPVIKVLASITTMTGWTKNDLGKWKNLPNELPDYQSGLLRDSHSCEHISIIELASLAYKNKTLRIVAKTRKSYIRRNIVVHSLYNTDYWVFDGFQRDTTIGNDETVLSQIFKTFYFGTVSRVDNAPSWKQLSDDIVIHW